MKRILLLGLIAVFIIFTDNVYAELDLAKAEKVLDKFSKKEIEMMASIPEKPYFLLSLEPQKTQWDQYQELRSRRDAYRQIRSRLPRRFHAPRRRFNVWPRCAHSIFGPPFYPRRNVRALGERGRKKSGRIFLALRTI